MDSFNSIKELIKTLAKAEKLFTEMFGKRKAISYKYEDAINFVEREEDIELLIKKNILRQSGPYLEIDDLFLQFFEQVLEVNEEINTSYIHEHIQNVKENILYFLNENSESRKYGYLKAIKSALRKIGRVILRNIIDLNRNIDNTFKTEPNYKIKIAKLENYDRKRKDIHALIDQTERLVTEDEQTFFKSAQDEELKQITIQLRLLMNESQHNLIEIEKQIIDFLNRTKYQSGILEKIRQIKYLKDQHELGFKTNIRELLAQNRAVVFEPAPAYPLKLSLDMLQNDGAFEIIQKINARRISGARLMLPIAGGIAEGYLLTETEDEVFINLEELKNSFLASGNHLFDFIMNYSFPREADFGERVTVYCQMVSLYEKELNVSGDYLEQNEVEFAIVYPK